jgi:hypothetical protein
MGAPGGATFIEQVPCAQIRPLRQSGSTLGEEAVAEAIGAVLAYGVGVGISPIPIIAVILTLFSERARTNGSAFVVGWAIGLTALVTVTYLAVDALDVGSDTQADDGVAWIRIALGVALLVAAIRKWRARSTAADATPGWMASIDRATPVKTLGLALILSANPKNLVLAFGAAASLAQVATDTSNAVVGLVVFVLIGTSSVAIAVGYELVGGDSARATLDEAKAWLALNNGAVMAVLFLVFSAVLIAQGLGGGG